MNLDQIVDILQNDRNFMDCVSHWQEIPEQPAQVVSFPDNVDRRLVEALAKRGIQKPYIHQAQAIEKIISGENTVVVTPTASGKTLCYNVPVLNAILDKNESRALYLFPTKALSQDQIAELHQIDRKSVV